MRFYLRAVSYFRPDLRLIVFLLVIIAASTGLGLLQAWPAAIMIDSVLTPHPTNDWFHKLFLAPLPHSKIGQVIGVAAIGCLMKIVQDFLTLSRNMLRNRINNWGTMRLRSQMFAKLQSLSLGYHKKQPSGEAIYRLITDAKGPETILNVFIDAMVDGVTLLAMAGIMLSRNIPLTVFALSVTPLFVWTSISFGRRMKKRSIGAKTVDTNLTSQIQRVMSAIGLVQAFGREPEENRSFGVASLHSAKSWLRLNWQENFFGLSVATIQSLGGAIIFGYGGYLVWRDQFAHPIANGFTFGDVLVYFSYLGMLWAPLTRLTGVSPAIQGGVAGAERVFEVLDHNEPIQDGPDAITLPVRPRTLELESVSFAYHPGRPILRGVSVKIKPGQLVAFVGPSGAGKSTVLSLLPRFYDPAGGAVKLDGFDTRNVRLADLRKHIAIVPQESPMLAGTIAENIAFGFPGATADQIREAATLAGAAKFIEQMPDGYASAVADGGGNLSGGQRQRLAITRALLGNAPVLVLDEPTSALDPEQERQVTDTLLSLRGKRTIVLVTHRLGTVSECDQIFAMEQGRVVEQGTHVELMKVMGPYQRMVNEQARLDALAGDDSETWAA